MASYALRVPESLFEYARSAAAEKKVSTNQFLHHRQRREGLGPEDRSLCPRTHGAR